MSENDSKPKRGSAGGKARAEKLSKKELSAIAKNAAASRWAGDLPRATHTGSFKIGDVEITCANLVTEKRLLTQESFLKAIGRAGKAKGGTGSFAVDGLPPFLSASALNPFITSEIRQSTTPVFFRNESGVRAAGYDALLLPMVCEVYLKFRDSCLSAGKPIPGNYTHIIEACDILMRGFARVGIIALVDEATGYQADRDREELAKILEAYIAEELRPWIRTFPQEFFKQVYRIHGWNYDPTSNKHSPYMGKFINKYIYEQMPTGVLPALQGRNPKTEKGYRKHKHFQFLTTDTGCSHLDRMISTVTTLMRISDSKDEFEKHFEKAFPSTPFVQEELPLIIEVDEDEQED